MSVFRGLSAFGLPPPCLLLSARRSVGTYDNNFCGAYFVQVDRLFNLVGEYGQLLGAPVQVRLELNRIGQRFGEIGQTVRHVVFDGDLQEQGAAGQRLTHFVPQHHVPVAGAKADHGDDPVADQLAGFLESCQTQGRQLREDHLKQNGFRRYATLRKRTETNNYSDFKRSDCRSVRIRWIKTIKIKVKDNSCQFI